MEDIDKTQPSSNLNVSPEDEAPTIRPRTEEERKRGCRIGDFICGRYRIDSVLGRGGMGVVYKCHDRTSGINVAVKTILPGVGQSQYELDLTKENFQLVCKLHHQYIANYNSLEQDEQSGIYYLVMEYVDGEDIRSYLKKKKEDGVFEKHIQKLVRQAAEALDYAHSQQIVHKDIKPSNLMVDKKGNLKLLDFGIAAEVYVTTKKGGGSVGDQGFGGGTIHYMSPEQLAGKKDKPAMDQYSLAATVYDLISGKPPFNAPNDNALINCIKNEIPESLEGVSPAMIEAVAKGLAKKPEDRFENCLSFAKAMNLKTEKSSEPEIEIPRGKPLSREDRVACYDLLYELKEQFSAPPPMNQEFYQNFNRLEQRFKKYSERKPDSVVFQGLQQIQTSLQKLIQEAEYLENIEILRKEIRIREKEIESSKIQLKKNCLKIKKLSDEAASKQDYSVALDLLSEYKRSIENAITDSKKTTAPEADIQTEKKTPKTEQKSNHAEMKRTLWESAVNAGVKFSPDKKTLLKGPKTLTEFTVPDGVETIGKRAFSNCKKLKEITITEGVTVIEGYAFSNCSSLETITLPGSLKHIRTCVFSDCTELKNIVIPDSVTSIGVSAFNNCSGLKSVKLPEKLKNIRDFLFHGCSDMENVTIPDGVVNIGTMAFSGCCNLKNVSIPKSVMNISSLAFSGCDVLTDIKIPKYAQVSPDALPQQLLSRQKTGTEPSTKSHKKQSTANTAQLKNDDWTEAVNQGITFSKDRKTLIDCPQNVVEPIIPEGVTTIKEHAFSNCKKMKYITIPDSVIHIGEWAFSNCNKLTGITLPKNLENISDYTFYECYSLEQIDIPDKVKVVGINAFSDCRRLKNVKLPSGIQKIEHWSFSGCSNLENIIIPNGVTHIGTLAFYDCHKIKRLEIPDSVQMFGENFAPTNCKVVYTGSKWYLNYLKHFFWSIGILLFILILTQC